MIQGLTIKILLDSESFNRFIQPRIAQLLKLPVQPNSQFEVMVGNGNSLCRKLHSKLVGDSKTPFINPASIPFTCSWCRLLGASLLATFGPHLADYRATSLKFCSQGQFVTLHGLQRSTPTQP